MCDVAMLYITFFCLIAQQYPAITGKRTLENCTENFRYMVLGSAFLQCWTTNAHHTNPLETKKDYIDLKMLWHIRKVTSLKLFRVKHKGRVNLLVSMGMGNSIWILEKNWKDKNIWHDEKIRSKSKMVQTQKCHFPSIQTIAKDLQQIINYMINEWWWTLVLISSN